MTDFTSIELIPAYVGLAFILVGYILYKFPSKKINYFYGYRTPKSMSNQKNWDFSQTYSGMKLVQSGLVLLVIALSSFFMQAHFFKTPSITSILIIIAVIYVIVATELAIKKNNQ